MNTPLTLITAFLANLLVSYILVRFIYYPNKRPSKKKAHFIFTFLALSGVLFYVVLMMRNIEISIGLGFGLFAIFSVLRYRTSTIPIREMNYIFCSIALPIINTNLTDFSNWSFVLIADVTLLLLFLGLEKGWGFKDERVTSLKKPKA